MACPDPMYLHALVDGEVDAIGAAALERHFEECPSCRARREELEHMRIAIRQDVRALRAPDALRARIARSLDGEPGASTARAGSRSAAPRARWTWMAWPALGGAAMAAACAWLIVAPWRSDARLLDELAGAHVRSLMVAHLIDVESSDHHTVKPWFAGRADVSPPVADFAAQGYTLVGGRADYVDRQRAAVLVYRHGRHVINVFSWVGDAHSLPASGSRDGYRVNCWRTGTVQSCAISDTGKAELARLAALLQDLAARGE
ncbi:MAG TPA: zf-HC2 domain-containing protein [Steroidobacteraceae bacterium]|nr:zf-HC2 domain-containing protein [Steroidobacteraceae bacterium]